LSEPTPFMYSTGMKKSAHLTYVLALITVALWSTGFVFTRIAVAHVSPIPLSLIRFLFAAIPLLIVGFYKKVGLPKLKDWPLFLLMGFIGFSFYQTLFNFAMLSISAAVSSVVISTVPIMAAFFASLLFKEKLGKVGWLAICIEFFGIAILALWKREVALGKGFILILLAAPCFAAYNLLQRFSTKEYTALQSTIWTLISAALLMIGFIKPSLQEIVDAPWQAVAAIAFLGAVTSALGILMWSTALSMANQISDVTNFMFITPLFTAALEIALIGEYPDGGTIVGGLIILLGVALFNNRHRFNAGLKATVAMDITND